MTAHLPQTRQQSCASFEYAMEKRVTRPEKFLAAMEQVAPWVLLQQWFGLADEALKDAIYDGQAMRDFVGIYLSREVVSDATTLPNFCRMQGEHKLTTVLFDDLDANLAECGLLLREGTIVGVTTIAGPPSTKNEAHARDPAMHQTKKGNEWHRGMRAHIGADADSGLVHSLHTTVANESDIAHPGKVLHGQETVACLAAGYTGVDKRWEIIEAQAEGEIRGDDQWNVAKRRSTINRMAEATMKTLTKALERVKAQVRARVEHPVHVVKNVFEHKMVRYKGLAKNDAQPYGLFSLLNLVIAKK